MYLKVISYFRKEFFLHISTLIESELGTYMGLNLDLKIIDTLKTKVDENWKKMEGTFIQSVMVLIRSELNLGFVSYFYSDLLDNEVDFFYKEKIIPSDYTSNVTSEKKHF